MSSTEFSAEIYPETRLRHIVLITGLAVALAGAIAVLLATVPIWLKGPAFGAWTLLSWREVVARRRAWKRCSGIRFLGNGDIAVRDRAGGWAPARLDAGSLLLRRCGWLRIIADDGTGVYELVRGHCREDRDWRRLHVIWRHV
ncbi:MAG: hypothetical protein QNJ14_16495 [Woeseiaceae bacterium]|nr:hypothetical protein [Woeseiaceae bacterium]